MGTNYYLVISNRNFHIGKHSFGNAFMIAGSSIIRLAKLIYFSLKDNNQLNKIFEQCWSEIFEVLYSLQTNAHIESEKTANAIYFVLFHSIKMGGFLFDEYDKEYSLLNLSNIVREDAKYFPDDPTQTEIYKHYPFLVCGFDDFI